MNACRKHRPCLSPNTQRLRLVCRVARRYHLSILQAAEMVATKRTA